MNPKIYTVKEVAELFGVSTSTILREVKRENLRCFTVGNESRFTQYHIDEYTNIKNLGKTQKEMDLEEEKEKLLQVIKAKDEVIDNIKNLILKGVWLWATQK